MSKDRKIVSKDSSHKNYPTPSTSRGARSGKFVGDYKTKGRVPPVSSSNRKK